MYLNSRWKRSPVGRRPSCHAKTLLSTEKSTAWNPITIVMLANRSVWTSNVTLPTVRGPGSSHSVAAAPSAISSSPG